MHRFRTLNMIAACSVSLLAVCAKGHAEPVVGPALSEPILNPAYESLVIDPVSSALADRSELVPEEVAAPPSEPLPSLAQTPIEEVVATPTWYQPTYWVGPGSWESAIELGLNGSSGTSDTLSFRTGGYFKGKNDIRKVDFSLYYNSTMSEGVQTQNNSLLSARHDWLLQGSPWSVYALTQLFYDEFQAYDLNLNVNMGFGYQWIETELLKLGTQLGAGASREFGQPDSEWTPEAQLGFDYEHIVCAAHKLTAGVDYFPEFENFGRYRVLSELGWEIAISQPQNLSLKTAVTDRYDADPEGAKPHILNYSILLLWKL